MRHTHSGTSKQTITKIMTDRGYDEHCAFIGWAAYSSGQVTDIEEFILIAEVVSEIDTENGRELPKAARLTTALTVGGSIDGMIAKMSDLKDAGAMPACDFVKKVYEKAIERTEKQ